MRYTIIYFLQVIGLVAVATVFQRPVEVIIAEPLKSR